MNADEIVLDHLTERIIGSARIVSNALGAGFLLVQESVIVELKAIKTVAEIHRAQCINYRRATGLHVCLLFNFGNPRLDIKRVVPGL